MSRTHATGFRIAQTRLRCGYMTDSWRDRRRQCGHRGRCFYSKQLAKAAGGIVCHWRPNAATIVGDHDPGISPRYPVMPSDGKMAFAMTPAGLRIGGQVELAGLQAAPNWQRADVLLAFVRKVYPDGCSQICRRNGLNRGWGIVRPCRMGYLASGRRQVAADIVHAFGHGHVGLTAGAATGKIVAEIIAGRPVSLDLTPYSARRFA